jgi:hypothetical protein
LYVFKPLENYTFAQFEISSQSLLCNVGRIKVVVLTA